VRLSLAIALTCAGCGGADVAADAGAPDSISTAPLEIDVVVTPAWHSLGAAVFLHEPARPCECANDWPAMGECAYNSDAIDCDCRPAPGACVQSVWIESDGEVVSEGLDQYSVNSWRSYIPDEQLTPGRRFELVIEGCGASARLPLPTTDLPTATPGELVLEGSELALYWSSDDAGSATVASCDSDCMQPFTGRTVLQNSPCSWQRNQSVIFLAGGDPISTPLGTGRIWYGTERRSDEGIVYPRPVDAGRWALTDARHDHFPPAAVTVVVDGVEDRGEMRVDEVSLDPAADDPSATLMLAGEIELTDTVWELSLIATPMVDRLSVRPRGDAAYYVTLPHVIPKDPIELGSFEPERYVVRFGPAVLKVGFQELHLDDLLLDWTIGVVPRVELVSATRRDLR